MPATFSKPTKIPRWADTAGPANVVEPSPAKKDLGWELNEKPAHSYFNWLQHFTGEWTKWIDERLADGANKNEFVLKNPNNGTNLVF